MTSFAPLRDLDGIRPILSRISFLGGLTEEQLEAVAGHFEEASFPAGTIIAKEGEEPTHIYLIQSGRVSLEIGDGERRVMKRSFEVGDSFGEAALLSMVNNTATFAAAEDSVLAAFSRRSMNRLRKEDPDLFSRLILNMARDLARKLQYTDEMLLRIG